MSISKFNNPRIIKNTALVDFNDKNLKNVSLVEVKSKPTLEKYLTPNFYVDQAISDGVDNSPFLRLDPDEKRRLDEKTSLVCNSTLTLPTEKLNYLLDPRLIVD